MTVVTGLNGTHKNWWECDFISSFNAGVRALDIRVPYRAEQSSNEAP